MKVYPAVGLLVGTLVTEAKPTAITRDVVVVGGGVSGAHAAVWLRDYGKSAAVVEKHSVLGGHTAFYQDNNSGKSINVGVQAWMEYKNTMDFVARMGVSTNGSMQFAMLTEKFVDFKTGKPVEGYTAPLDADKYPALQRYLELCEKYEDMLLPGFDKFPAPDAIPEDLIMPFGQFMEKYNIAAAIPS